MDLSEVSYNAFISYKHGEIDSPAARYLQQSLEHFRAPKRINGKRHPFDRVFLDNGELSSCANFESQIKDCLINAEWLIVICSPNTPQSPWVSQEINTFLEYHDRDHILALLTNGNPETSFPEQLKGTDDVSEVLAADATGDTVAKVKNKIRKDALLRIAAPMLGTTYDTLKQRRKTYVMQRLAAATAAGLFFVLLFLMYALLQNRRINDELTRTQINESKYLAQMSEQELESGNRNKAVQLALNALPASGDDDSRPIVSDAVSALSNAVYAYTPASFNTLNVDNCMSIDAAPDPGLTCTSPDESKLLTVDTAGKLSLFSLSDGRLLYSADSSDFQSTICSVCFVSDTHFIVFLEDSFMCIDTDTHEAVWKTAYTTDNTSLSYLSELSQKNFAVFEDTHTLYTVLNLDYYIYLCTIDYENGVIQDMLLLDDSCYYLSAIAVSDDRKFAAISMKCGLHNDDSHASLVICNLEKKKSKTVAVTYPDVIDVAFAEDNHLVAISTTYETFDILTSSEYNYALDCLDITGKTIWSFENVSAQSNPTADLLITPQYTEDSDDAQDTVIAHFGNELIFLNPEDGSKIYTAYFPDNIIGMGCWTKARICVALANGNCYWIHDCSFEYKIPCTSKLSEDFTNAIFLPGQSEFILFSTTLPVIYELSYSAGDNDITYLSTPEEGFSSYGVTYLKDMSGTEWRIVITDDDLCVYEPLSASPTAAATVPELELDSVCGFGRTNGHDVLYYIYDGCIVGLDMNDGSTLSGVELPSYEDGPDELTWHTVGWRENTCYLCSLSLPFLLAYDCSSCEFEKLYPAKGSANLCTYQCVISEDNRYIALIMCGDAYYDIETGKDFDYNQEITSSLFVYDTADNSWSNLTDILEQLNLQLYNDVFRYSSSETIAFSKGGHELAVCNNGDISIIDIDTKTLSSTLDTSCSSHCSLLYISENKLIIIGDNGYLTLWDTESDQLISKSSQIYTAGYGLYLLQGPGKNDCKKTSAITENGDHPELYGCFSGKNYYIEFQEDDGYSGYYSYVYQIDPDWNFSVCLKLHSAIADLNSHEVLFATTEAGGSIGFYRIYTLDELISKGKAMLTF